MDLSGTSDTVFTIFVVHEVPDPSQLLRENTLLLKPGCTLYSTEPPFIVSGREFRDNLTLAETRLPETGKQC
jgi:2-polyprenyl-3-methyl-5-hydroxy-6-metoxy-1,4-benzoquinol methylase